MRVFTREAEMINLIQTMIEHKEAVMTLNSLQDIRNIKVALWPLVYQTHPLSNQLIHAAADLLRVYHEEEWCLKEAALAKKNSMEVAAYTAAYLREHQKDT